MTEETWNPSEEESPAPPDDKSAPLSGKSAHGDPEPEIRRRLVWVLLLAFFAGSLATIPFMEQVDPDAGSVTGIEGIAVVLFECLFGWLWIEIGTRNAARTGLVNPWLRRWIGKDESAELHLRSGLVASVAGGLAMGFLVGGLGLGLDRVIPVSRPIHWSIAAGLLASLGAGITEEITFRLGVMSLVLVLFPVGATRRLRPSDRVWIANGIAAVLFGAMHIVNLAALGTVTVFGVLGVIGLNAVVGLYCGWLAWKYDLVAAMIAHAMVDVVLKGIGPVLAP